MLTYLSLTNFLFMDPITLDVDQGMTVITGETGSGKSVLLGALGLVLGNRVEGDVIKPPHDRCALQAVFDITMHQAAQQWLADHAIEHEGECIIKRLIMRDGKTRSLVNGQVVTQKQVRVLANDLIHMHSQHAHQGLCVPEKQRMVLDHYANHPELLAEVQAAYTAWQSIQSQMDVVRAAAKQSSQAELWQYQLHELEQIALQADELAQLEAEQRQLSNMTQIMDVSQQTLATLTDDVKLQQATQQLQDLQQSGLVNAIQLLQQATIHCEEAVRDIQDYMGQLVCNPQRLQQITQRLQHIYDLARKHQINPEQLLERQQQLAQQLAAMENVQQQLSTLQQRSDSCLQQYQTVAAQLTASRLAAAKCLAQAIEQHMQQLGMPNSQFAIELRATDQPSVQGNDKIIFTVTTNPGQPLRPLASVVSGGELSRISLAIQVLTAHNAPTLVFDEVDTGISGSTAAIVGSLLRQLSATTQIICITHLPQVAACGQHHWQVQKQVSGDDTTVEIEVLDCPAQIREVARMLGGLRITQQTLAHAKEMMETANS